MRTHRRFLFCAGLAILALGLSGCPRRQGEPGDAGSCPPPAGVCAPPSFSIQPEQVWQPVAGRIVILDPGHGGNDRGASHFGLLEKDINLDLARRTASALAAKGVIVQQTRQSDVFIPLPDRSAFANRHPNAVFVSIHVNASESNPNASGVETFILSKQFTDDERGKTAAGKIQAADSQSEYAKKTLADLTTRSRNRGPALAASLQRSLVGRLGEVDRGVKPGNLAVLRETYFCPAVLVEVGFLTNRKTAAAMASEDWRRRTSDALAEGIIDYLRQPE